MFVYVVFVGVALAGQVMGAGDRYSGAVGSQNPPEVYSLPPGNAARDSQNQPPLATRPGPMLQGAAPNVQSAAPQNAGPAYGYGTPQSAVSPPPRSPIGGEQDNGPKPSGLMRTMLTAPTGSRLTGQPVKLADVVRGAGSRQEQAQRVDAYWDLCSSVADYYLSLREQDELQKLRTTVSRVGPTWQQAESELGVRIGTSQRGAVAAQYRLASMLGRGGDSLPLPGDPPHCGDYYARYSQVFVGRQSAEAQQLSELLPLRYEELKDAATAVARAQEWLDGIAAQRSDASDGTGTLRALELLALRRRAFIQIARDYNRRIARYTELASPGEIGADRLLGMLIKQEGGDSTATRNNSPAPPLNRQSQTKSTAPPRTFAEGWEPLKSDGEPPAAKHDESVAPASAEAPSDPHVEHSLLVTPP
jgi:hypothetical protein